ncbi:MAG: HAD hydrolase-like protein [Gammaproteobacteria bacterium]|nr:HAD hydrolase-like protein [Gammaproteobacteria bacterium]MDE0247235.1 HAD hydrolase-like protein [Gammaproteobacteria bacterium]
MHLVVFDIDGTLVDSSEINSRLYVEAVESVLGIQFDDNWSRYTHVTDSGILNEIMDEAGGHVDRPLVTARIKEEFVRVVSDHIGREGQMPEIAGARAFVERLTSHPGASVAVATGGWRETAEMKLRGIGLDPGKLCLASSSDAFSRIEIMRIAAERALRGRHATRTTYFGDRPWDLRASRELGYGFVAVGDNVVWPVRYPDFRDAEAILSELGLGS